MAVSLCSVALWTVVLQWHTVSGRGCYQDPKVYIVTLSLEKQQKLLLKARETCLREMFIHKSSISGLHCNQTFDNVVCWPDTRAGTVAEQNCPNYINNFDTRAKAKRECLPTGQWYVHPDYNQTWTDFTACQKKEDPRATLMRHLSVIKTFCLVGYIVSLVCLIVAVAFLIGLRRLHCQRNLIHINLFVSFILRCVVCLVKDVFHTPEGHSSVINNKATLTPEGSNWSCKLVFALFNYIIVANYMWIFIEGLYINILIFLSTFKKIKRFHMYIVAGWLLPVLCVIPWILVRRFLEDTMCWNTHLAENKFVWIIRGPIVATIVINFMFFINIIRVIFMKLRASQMNDNRRYRKLARSTLILIPLFGVYYMISVVMPECMSPSVELVWLYVESGVNSFQGFLVALLFCFLNGEVQQEIRKEWNRKFSINRFGNDSPQSSRMLSTAALMRKTSLSPVNLTRDKYKSEERNLKEERLLTNSYERYVNDIKYPEGDVKQEDARLL